MTGDRDRGAGPGGWTRRALPIALLLAVALRAEYLRELLGTPFAHNLLLDAEWYDGAARALLAGDAIAPDRPWFRPPLYPMLLAGLYAISNGSLLLVRLVQAALGVLQVVLVHRIARRTHGDTAAAIASLLAAGYGMFIYFEGEILTTALGTFLTTAAVWLLLEGDARRSPLRLGAGGLAIGLAAITHGSAVTLAVPAVLWAAAGEERSRGARLAAALAVAIGVALPLAATSARNLAVAGVAAPVGTSGGINFWVGNNPDSDGKSALAPGIAEADQVLVDEDRWRDTIDRAGEVLAERDLGRPLTPTEIGRYWYGRGLAWMRDRPLDALRHLARKTVFVLNGYEISNNRDLRDQARRFTPILGLFLAQFSVLLPFALLGLLRGGLATRPRRLLVAMLVVHGATLVAFFVCARYRQSAVAWWIPFGAAGLLAVVGDVRRARAEPARAAATGLVLALLFAATNARVVTGLGIADVVSDRDAPFHRFNLAVLFERRGDLERAIDEYRAAGESGVADPRIWLNLGNCLARTGRGEEARDAYRRVIRIAPDYEAAVRGNLGILASEERDWAEAIRQFDRALELDPRHAAAHAGIGVAHLAAGHVDEAIVAFRRALELGGGPELPLRRSLAAAYLQAGLPEEAAAECETALARAPDDLDTVLLLARIRVIQGRDGDAAALWERARALAPGSPVVQRAMDDAHAAAPERSP